MGEKLSHCLYVGSLLWACAYGACTTTTIDSGVRDGGGSGGTAGNGGEAGEASGGSGGSGETGGGGSGGAQSSGSSGGDTGSGGSPTGGSGGSAAGASVGGTSGAGGAPEVSCPGATPNSGAPCGGDLHGTWDVAMCSLAITGTVDLGRLGLGCTEGTITSGEMEVSGSIVFHPNGTTTDRTTTIGSETIELAMECLSISGTEVTCEFISAPLRSGLGLRTAECEPTMNGGCTCVATFDQSGGLARVSPNPSSDGTYGTSGETFSLSTEVEEAEYEYCVANDLMTLRPRDSLIGTLSEPVILQLR